MSNPTYNSSNTVVEGAFFPLYFFSSYKEGTTELIEEVGSSSSSSESPFSSDEDAVELGGRTYRIIYTSAGTEVFSAEKIQRWIGVFDSLPIVVPSNVSSWKSLSWASTVPSGTTLRFHVRSAADESSLESAVWSKPLLNAAEEDISEEKGKILQFRIVMESEYDALAGTAASPLVEAVYASCYVRGLSQNFYTSVIPLGFQPKHILLTYNGTIPDNALLTFAVTTMDSLAANHYQDIEPNTVVALDKVPDAQNIKVSISAAGSSETPFIIDEFAIALGGDDFIQLSP